MSVCGSLSLLTWSFILECCFFSFSCLYTLQSLISTFLIPDTQLLLKSHPEGKLIQHHSPLSNGLTWLLGRKSWGIAAESCKTRPGSWNTLSCDTSWVVTHYSTCHPKTLWEHSYRSQKKAYWFDKGILSPDDFYNVLKLSNLHLVTFSENFSISKRMWTLEIYKISNVSEDLWSAEFHVKDISDKSKPMFSR